MGQKVDVGHVKEVIHELYNSLAERPEQSARLLDILDVLAQVYKKIDQEEYPEYLVDRLVKYIYAVGFNNKIRFLGQDGKLLVELSDVAKKAGLNSRYRADYSDKSQFYGFFEEFPRR
ncbi:bacteriocin immunity protein [Ligilactobacillus animalis]|uniref:bacteriocin immunity protein n=1 Tax=Ligilactobacillus animalis TaxID=1605 RepID=UPI0002195248|nr:bacteriocin immunity protein [Ligilactobacillus animalis]KRM58861.1 bacteriocin immunity protein [Ligilactobacillus animalis KCTC 3501 = DSM 20602]MBU5279320.1 bacteriocin immunity protein [Ligilactobacillus animalis]MDQ2233461.1 bacteriocin immunity protein [Ligilactobacillus animalis]